MRTGLVLQEVQHRLRSVLETLFQFIPAGVGSENALPALSRQEVRKVLREGARWAVARGFGSETDLHFTEENGRMEEVDPDAVSEKAVERGRQQLGTLGSGNHFIEIDYVEEIFDVDAADCFGIFPGEICVFLHSGSRGLGHQVCTDHLEKMNAAVRKYGLQVPDRQLSCAPIQSTEGNDYYQAMKAASNYAWANRQIMGAMVERAFCQSLQLSPNSLGCRLVYDISHNIAKKERHQVDGRMRSVMVHRKGATRALPAGHELVPAAYRRAGQPVFVPGDMGTGSYLLVGTPLALEASFGSSCHGAGRRWSRAQALKQAKGKDLFRVMESMGVQVMAAGKKTVAEEMPGAYKDLEEVVECAVSAGISRKVARFRPLGCIKG